MNAPLRIDGDVEQLDAILHAIVELDREASIVNDSLAAARKAAADLMAAIGTKGTIIQHDDMTYRVKVERYTRTVCECHRSEPWACEARAERAIVLVDEPSPAAVYVRPILPASGRFDGRPSANTRG